MGYISVDQILAKAKFRLSLTHSNQHDIELSDLIREGANSARCGSDFIYRCGDEPIVNGRVELPEDFNRAVLVKPYSVTTTEDDEDEDDEDETTVTYSTYTYVETAFAAEFGISSSGMPGTYQIIGNCIHFNSAVTFTHCTFVYRAYSRDNNNLPMIHEDAERGLSAYCASQFATKAIANYTPFQINKWDREWVAQRGRIVGLAAQRNFFQNMPDIQSLMKALVTVKRVNIE